MIENFIFQSGGKSMKDSIELYKQYLKTGDEQCLHEIILNHKETILRMIDKVLEKENLTYIKSEEYFSDAYYDIFQRLKTINPEAATSHPLIIYTYIRRWTVFSLRPLIEKENEMNDNMTYTRSLDYKEVECKEDIVRAFLAEQKSEFIKKYMLRLTPSEKKVMSLLYGFETSDGLLSVQEIAEKMNLSRTRVYQLQESAFKKIAKEIIKDNKNLSILNLDKNEVKERLNKKNYR